MERAWLHVFRIAFILYCICSVNTVHSMKIFCIHGRDLPECAVRNNHCEEYSQCNILGLTFNHGTWVCKLINYQYNIIPQFLFFFLQTIYCNSPVLWGRSRGTQLLVINFLKPFPWATHHIKWKSLKGTSTKTQLQFSLFICGSKWYVDKKHCENS